MMDRKESLLVGGAVLGFVALIVFLIFMSVKDGENYKAWCESQGGHVDSSSKTVTTVGGDGKVGIGTVTTTFCLSSDGRIIDIRD